MAEPTAAMTFQEWLSAVLAQRRWTPAQLARASQTDLSGIFQQQREPTYIVQMRLARTLDLPPEYLCARVQEHRCAMKVRARQKVLTAATELLSNQPARSLGAERVFLQQYTALPREDRVAVWAELAALKLPLAPDFQAQLQALASAPEPDHA